MYSIKFHKDIENDLAILDSEILKEALEFIAKLEQDYYRYSLPLYNMEGRDLRGCRKTYFYDAKYRIVSRVENDTIEIVNIIAVGKRENFEVYNSAASRL